MRSFPTEAKVGIFVVITVFALVYLTVRINHAGFSLRKSKTLYINFDNASGLLTRTPVEFAGIRVGFVEAIDLVNSKARVEVKIDPRVPVYQDSDVSLQNRGILGEKIITISGGGREPEVPDGGAINAENSGATFDEALHNFNEIASSIKDLIKGGQGKPSLRDIIANVNDITEDLRGLVRSNRTDMNSIIQNVHEFSKMISGNDLKRIVENLKDTSETMKSFVSDANPELRDVVKDFKGTMTKIDSTVEALNRIVSKVDRGEGTVGKLLNDDTTVNKVNDTLDGINDFVGRIRRLEIAVGYRGEFLSTAHQVQSTASFQIRPAADKYFLFEFTDGPISYGKTDETITTTTTSPPGTSIVEKRFKQTDNFEFTAIFARRFYDLVLKAGLMRSSGGVGFEYYLLRDHFSFGLDAFDFSRSQNAHLRAYAALHLFKVFNLIGGVDDLINGNGERNYFGGLGIMLTDNDIKALVSLAPLMAAGQ